MYRVSVRPAVLLVVMALAGLASAAPRGIYLEAPAGERYAERNPDGVTVLPNGRMLMPEGRNIVVAPHPYGLAVSPDGSMVATSNSGTGPFSISLLSRLDAATPRLRQIPSAGEADEDDEGATDPEGDDEDVQSVFMGVAFAPDNRTVYASSGEKGSILILDGPSHRKTGEISANGELGGVDWQESFTGDLALTRDGRTLYVADNSNFRLVIVDTATRKVTGSVPVGRYPYAVALSPDERTVYVANIGMFAYSRVTPAAGGTATPGGLSFPPFGFPSREAEEGAVVEGYDVPGLGDPNVDESFSVWAVDVSSAQPVVIAKVKTGTLVGARGERYESVGGSSPNALAVSERYVFVSNGSNDNVQAIDRATHTVAYTLPLCPSPLVARIKGVMPFGLAFSPDGSRLYVAESGLNAVGVIDVPGRAVLGHIPVCWFPSRLAVSPDGRTVYVANAKGFGAGPNGGPGFVPGPEGNNIGRLMRGSVSIVPVPEDAALPALTRRMLECNGITNRYLEAARREPSAVPRGTGKPSEQIEYVVFITKENRTYDEVFGELPGGRGEPSLARFGVDATVGEHSHVNVMPNHRRLAEEYAVSDNFYMNSDHSADGHRWLVGVPPNVWVETNVSASYGGQRGESMATPGRRAIFGANSALAPEDYLEDGSIWEHLYRSGVPFRNYGEGFELASINEGAGLKPTGARLSLNIPMPKVLFDNSSREFPTFNMNIPDQYRADQFLREFRERFAEDPAAMPRYLYIYLPQDHGAGVRAESGYPYLASYMADNDYAVGRVVEALSHSRYWSKMAIIITEDDSQGGVDSVDAHRSVLLVVSPYSRPGYVSHRHTDISSIHKTAFALLGMPPLNLFDALSSDLSDCLTTTAAARPYTAIAPDPRIFDPAKARDPLDPDYQKARLLPSIELDGAEEAERQRNL